ncbi:MAG: hypothetical protein QW290_08660 [Sulfolobales archaeon]
MYRAHNSLPLTYLTFGSTTVYGILAIRFATITVISRMKKVAFSIG